MAVRKTFQEDRRSGAIRCDFFEMSISGWMDQNHSSTLKLESQYGMERHMQSRAQGNFCQKQTTWKERIQKGETGKEQKSKDWFIHSLVYFQILPVILTLSTFFSHKFCRLLICWQLCFSWMHAELLDGTGGGVVACLRLRKRTCLRRVLRTLSLISSVSFFSFSPSFSSSCSTTFVATHGAVSTSKTLDFAGATRTGDSWGISVTFMVHDADQTKDDLRLMRLWYWRFDYWWKGSCQ